MVISGAETSNMQTKSLSQHGEKEAIIASPIGRALHNMPESPPRALEAELQVRFLFARARSRLHPREKQCSYTMDLSRALTRRTSQGHGTQAITPLRAAEEPSFALTTPSTTHGRQQAGTEAIVRKVSWCSPIPEGLVELHSPVRQGRSSLHLGG